MVALTPITGARFVIGHEQATCKTAGRRQRRKSPQPWLAQHPTKPSTCSFPSMPLWGLEARRRRQDHRWLAMVRINIVQTGHPAYLFQATLSESRVATWQPGLTPSVFPSRSLPIQVLREAGHMMIVDREWPTSSGIPAPVVVATPGMLQVDHLPPPLGPPRLMSEWITSPPPCGSLLAAADM